MAEVTQGELQDQIVSFQGGTDTGHQPRLLQPDRCVRSINCSYRGGFLSNRPGFKKWILRYANPADQNLFEQGKFQGACYFPDLVFYKPSIVVVSGSNLYQLQLESGYANVIALSYGYLNPYVQRCYFCVADKYLVVQDGQNPPLTWDGSTVAASTTVPVGTIMAYGQGRLFVKVGSRAVRAGDQLGSVTGAPLTFTETNYLDEGGDFGPPSFVGEITSMMFVPIQDTASGQGSLLIFGTDGAITAKVEYPRETTFSSAGQLLTIGWKDIGSNSVNAGFITVTLVNNGSLGDLSPVAVNGDIWYRAYNGWCSYRNARAQSMQPSGNGGTWAQTSFSSEVQHRVNDESEPLLWYGSGIYFDNRLIVTCVPTQGPNGIYHQGLLVLDFHPVSSVAITPSAYLQLYMNPYPVWNDLWTGILPYQLLEGSINSENKAFCLANDNGRIALYEITKDDPFDNFGTSDQPIQSSIESRAFIFQNDREEKRLYGGDIWFNNLRGDVNVTASYRPDEYPNWFPWYNNIIRTQYRTGTDEQVFPLQYYQPAFEPRFQLPTPPNSDDTATGRQSWRGYSFQIRLDITGSWSISRLRLHAQRLIEKAKFMDRQP
jgi:hypothetical protein